MDFENFEIFVTDEKITEYLLNPVHHKGKHKCKFFQKYGFTIKDWQVLKKSLIEHFQKHEDKTIEHTEFVIMLIVKGELDTPSGKKPNIKTVWSVDFVHNYIKLITAYPL